MDKRHLLLSLTVFVGLTTVALILLFQNYGVHIRQQIAATSLISAQSLGLAWGSDDPTTPTQFSPSLANANKTGSNDTKTPTTVRPPVALKTPTTVRPSVKTAPEPTNRPMLCQGCFFSNFTSLIENPDICSQSKGTSPELIMMITSSPDGFERRQAIRDTWVSATKNNTAHVRHVFLLGTTKDSAVSEKIKTESQRFRDILLSDFVDAYGNLTYKTMVGLHWIVSRCGQAKFFLKTDHDMYVFVNRILDLARKNEKTLMTSLGGACYQTAQPWRNPKTKYYASIRSYPQSTYPGFCSGTGYVSTLNLARKAVETSPNIPFFHLEDVYLTLVLRHLHFQLTKYPGFAEGSGVCRTPSRASRTMTIHEVIPQKMREFWANKCGV